MHTPHKKLKRVLIYITINEQPPNHTEGDARITNQIVSGTNNAHLAKTNVPWRRSVCSIALSNDDNVNCTGQRRRVDFVVETFHVREQLANDIHCEAGFDLAKLCH